MSAFDPKRTLIGTSSPRVFVGTIPSLGLGGLHEATRVHHFNWKRGGVAAHGASAAAGNAGDRICQLGFTTRLRETVGSLSQGVERDRLCRWPERHN